MRAGQLMPELARRSPCHPVKRSGDPVNMEPDFLEDDAPPTFERVPPQDLEAEQSVLGGMLLSKEAIADVARILTSGTEFYKPAHETIYDAILTVYARGNEKADPIT